MKRSPAPSSRSTPAARALLALMLAGAAHSLHAASTTWSATSTDANWATGANWAAGTAPGTAAGGYGNASRNADIATFNTSLTSDIGSSINPIIIDANRFLGGITFDTSSVGAFTIGTTTGNLLQLDQGGRIIMNAGVTSAQVINAPIQIRAQSSFNPTYSLINNATDSAATLTIGGTIATNSSTGRGVNWVLDGTNTGTNTVSGAISGGGSGGFTPLTKNGTGTWKLTGANTLGSVTINNGTLIAGNVNALGTGIATVNGGTLQVENVALNNSSVALNNSGAVQGTGTDASVKIVNVGATATTVGLSTSGSSDVLTVGLAANGLTGGQASTVINVSGPGTVSLGNASNYAGGFSINSGTLKLGNATALGSATSANVAFGSGSTGTLAINGNAVTLAKLNSNATVGSPVVENNSATSGSLTVSDTSGSSSYAGIIRDGAAGGALGLVKNGASTLILSGANTYTGGTTVSGGTLAANSSGALGTGTVSVASGATLSTNTIANLGSLNLTGGGGLLLADFNSKFVSSGTVSISGSSNLITLSGSTGSSGSTYTLLSGSNLSASGISLTGSGVANQTIAVGSSATVGRTTYDFTATATALQLSITGGAFNLTWNGGSANWNTTDANWQKNGTGSNIAFFAGDNITISTGDTINLNSGAVSAGTLLVNNSTGTATLNGSGLSVTGFTKSGAGDLVVNNVLTSPAGITVQAGNVTLNAANSMSGAIIVSGGKLALGVNDAAGSGSATLTVNGGQFDLGSSNQSLSNITLTSGSITGTTGVLTATTSAIDAQSGTINVSLAGSVGLTKSTAGTVILSGTNTYTGATTISGGILQIGNGGTSGSIAGTSGVANNGTLAYNRSDALTVGYVISGAGNLVNDGTGTLILNNANTYSGATVINAGTLQIGNGGTTGSIANTSGVTNNGTLAYNRSDALAVGYAISGTGAVVKDGAGTLTLNAANSYAGGTTLNAGTLALGNGAAAGTGTITALNGTTISATTGVGSGGVGNTITLSGTNANVTITNANASGGYTGSVVGSSDQFLTTSGAGGQPVNFNATTQQFTNFLGTVVVSSGSTLAFRATSLNNGGNNTTFQVDGFLSTRNNGFIALGALTGSGTVSMGGSGSNGGRLTYTIGAKNIDTTFSGVIQEADAVNGKQVNVTKVGTGSLTLSGVNTYTGTTSITGGTLIVNGSLANTVVTVGASGVLGGTGVIGGATTVNGALNPGNSPGVLTFNTDLTLAGVGNFEINSATRGTGYDAVNVGGTVTYGGVLNLIFGTTFLVGGENLSLFNGLNGTDAPLDAGSFTQIELQGAYTASLTNNSGIWTGTAGGLDFTFTQDTGILSVLTGAAIPEPSTYAMLAGVLGLAYAALRRRRRA
jgi:fibronectin-binding autotransporter adhesin